MSVSSSFLTRLRIMLCGCFLDQYDDFGGLWSYMLCVSVLIVIWGINFMGFDVLFGQKVMFFFLLCFYVLNSYVFSCSFRFESELRYQSVTSSPSNRTFLFFALKNRWIWMNFILGMEQSWEKIAACCFQLIIRILGFVWTL